jgi:hypothetical protein
LCSDCLPQRFRSDSAVIPQRFHSDHPATAQRLLIIPQ